MKRILPIEVVIGFIGLLAVLIGITWAAPLVYYTGGCLFTHSHANVCILPSK